MVYWRRTIIEKKNNQLLKNLFLKKWNDIFIYDSMNNSTITYGDLFTKIIFYKKTFENLGLKPNDKICLILPNGSDFLFLLFASFFHELIVIPIDPTRGKIEINEIVEQTNPVLIIHDDSLVLTTKNLKNIGDLKNLKDVKISKDDTNIFDHLDFDKICLITFTSGSTGIPKGIMHSLNNLISSALSFNTFFKFNFSSIFLHNLPMSYMAGILNLIILPLVSESKIVLTVKFDISQLANFWYLPIKFSVNTFWFTPTIIELLNEFDRGDQGIEFGKNYKITGCVGTAPLKKSSKEKFEEKYQISLFESYGLSETLFVSTNSHLNDKSGTVGKNLDEVKISFSQDNEILVNVPWIMKGIFPKKEKYELYPTGDIGFIDNEYLVISDRKKNLIVKGGLNISPKRIEDYIQNTQIFNNYIIIGKEDKFLSEKIVCFYTDKKIESEKIKNLNQKIIEDLGREHAIDEFFQINEIPKNFNGKIDRIKLLKMCEEM